MQQLPVSDDSDSEISEYFAILDKVLEDRRVTENEGNQLLELALEAGLSRSAVIDAHKKYMLDLCRIAWDDGIITDSEIRDIEDVRHLLQISDDDFLNVFEQAETEYKTGSKPRKPDTRQAELNGKTICFTGTMLCRINGEIASRNLAQRIASERGLQITDSCTRKLDILVTSDPDSMSGKAKKARKYGVRIIAEPVFWNMMGIDVE